VAVLTNNDSVTHNFIIPTGMAGPVYVTGTNAGDFTLPATGANNCLGMSSFGPGASCMLYVTFTPGNTGIRTAEIVTNDDVSNGPQTVYLSGTGQ
jgi:hypothetical protein